MSCINNSIIKIRSLSFVASIIYIISYSVSVSGQTSTTIAPLPTISGQLAGAIQGNFQVNEFGAATYNIPLAVPPGTNNMIPSLSLNYDSSSGRGALGIGWSIGGLSSISRCPTTLAQEGFVDGVNFNDNDRFCLDGQKLIVVNGIYGASGTEYRTETDSFAKVISNGRLGSGPLSFVVYQKNGLISEFGTTDDSRLQSQAQSSVIAWQLNKVSDRRGNFYNISYQKNLATGSVIPIQINYTGNTSAGLTPYNSVRFEYFAHQYPITGYINASLLTNGNLLRKVKMYTGQNLAWEYQFTYNGADPFSLEARLANIKECSPTGECLPPTYLYWLTTDTTTSSYTSYPTLAAFSPAQNYPVGASTQPVLTGDWNGDGKTDVARVANSEIYTFTSYSNGMGWYGKILPGEPTDNPTNDTAYQFKVYLYSRFPEKYPAITGDWNGDGKTDIGRVGNTYTTFYLSTGQGFSAYTSVSDFSPAGGYTDVIVYPMLTGDWNGDGRTDIGRVTGANVTLYISQGNSFIPFNSIPDFSPSHGYSNNSTYPILTGDWNGDGLTDIARLHNNGVRFYVSNGAGFVFFGDYANLSSAQGYTDNSTYPLISGDWNGDGITDLARVSSQGVTFCDSMGYGGQFATCRNLNDLSPAHGYTNDNSNPIFAVDLNSDGITDIARISNAGINFYLQKSGVFLPQIRLDNLAPNYGYSSNEINPLLLGDWNGDGFVDLGRVSSTGVTFLNKVANASTLLNNITDGFGKRIYIVYETLTKSSIYTKGGSAVYPQVDIKGPIRVVTQIATTNGLGGYSWDLYTYKGLQANLLGRGSLGFEQISVLDYETGITTTTTYKQEFPYKFLPIKKEQFLSNGTLINKNENTWSTISPFSGVFFPYVSLNTEDQYELNGTLVKRATTERSIDSFGNPLSTISTDNVGASETTINTYSNNDVNWQIGKLIKSQVIKKNSDVNLPNITRTASYIYESASGDLSKETLQLDSNNTSQLHKTFTYNILGCLKQTIISGTGISTRIENNVYDNKGQFIIQKINPLSQSEYFEYDTRHGLITKHKDLNGLITLFNYDTFGRLSNQTEPDGTQTRTVYYLPQVGTLSNTSYFVRKDSSGVPPTIVYFDALSREIRKETIGFDGKKILVDVAYDNKGLQSNISEPYFEGSIPLWTTNEYDIIGRITRVIAPGNRQTATSYSGLTTTTTNTLGQISTVVFDLQNKIVSSTDALNGTVNYKYDAFGNVTEIRDHFGNTTKITYDLRGNRTKIIDPDTGMSTFSYDALGQLLSQTNAKGEVISYTYDLLGRKTQRNANGNISNWIYDTKPYGKGKVASLTNSANNYSFSVNYDTLGRPINDTHSYSSGAYTSEVSYDQYGRISKVIYPSGFAIQNIYNNYGYLSQVNRASDGMVFWRADILNARGQFEKQTLGNGLVTSKLFDLNTGYIQSIQTGAIQNLSFQFDALGNLTQRRDLRVNATENFTYDSLNRLTHAQVLGQAAQTVTYDALGNIISRNDVGIYSYGANGAGPHAVTSITGPKPNTYQYDIAGNRISSIEGTITYSASGKPISIKKGSHELQYILDPNDHRVEELTYSSGTLISRKAYVGATFERIIKTNSIENIHYIKGGDGVVAIYSSLQNTGSPVINKTKYLHTDHLGSIQTITNESGAILEVSSYDSWGKRRNPITWSVDGETPSSQISRGYTGHENLDLVGLVHMNGRVYDPSIGRFVSADPYIQDPTSLQGLNRYTYANNNPLSFTDPSGHFFKKLFKSVGQFLKKALPIAISLVVSYQFTPIFSKIFDIGTTGLRGAISAGLTKFGTGTVAAATSAAITGGNIREITRSAVRGGVISGITAGLSFPIEQQFPSWNESIIDVKKNNHILEILRDTNAIKDQIARMGLKAVVHGAVSDVFGGQFREGLLGSLKADAFAWGSTYLAEAEFKAEWEAASRNHTILCDVIQDPQNVKELLRHLSMSTRTATVDGILSQRKIQVGIAVLDWQINNHGVAGSDDWLSGEGGIVMNLVGKYIPGQQSVSVYHDFLAQGFGRSLGLAHDATLTKSFSSLTIPPAVFAIQYSSGYRDHAELLRLSR